MDTRKFIKCKKCGWPVTVKTIDVQVNTTTPFSKWRIDEIADCGQCGHYETLEKGEET